MRVPPVPGADGVVHPYLADDFRFPGSTYDLQFAVNDRSFVNRSSMGLASNPSPDPDSSSHVDFETMQQQQEQEQQMAMPTPPYADVAPPSSSSITQRTSIRLEFDQLCHMRRVSEAAIMDLCQQVDQRLRHARNLMRLGAQIPMPQTIPILEFVMHGEEVVKGHREIIRSVDEALERMVTFGIMVEDLVEVSSAALRD